MRRVNLILVAGMLVTFLLHAIMGALQLAGANADAQKPVAWICVGFIAAHTVVTTILGIQTLRARRKSGAGYFRANQLFWARRISGAAILIPLVMHLVFFRASNAEAYRLQVFTAGRLISQLLLVLALALHVLLNVKPLMIALGVRDTKSFTTDLMLILSVVLLLAGAAFVVYYLRWLRV